MTYNPMFSMVLRSLLASIFALYTTAGFAEHQFHMTQSHDGVITIESRDEAISQVTPLRLKGYEIVAIEEDGDVLIESLIDDDSSDDGLLRLSPADMIAPRFQFVTATQDAILLRNTETDSLYLHRDPGSKAEGEVRLIWHSPFSVYKDMPQKKSKKSKRSSKRKKRKRKKRKYRR